MKYNIKLIRVFKRLIEIHLNEKTLNVRYEYTERYGISEFVRDSFLAENELIEATKNQKEAQLNLYRGWLKIFFVITKEYYKYLTAGGIFYFDVDGKKEKIVLKVGYNNSPPNVYVKILFWLKDIITTIEQMHPDLARKEFETLQDTKNQPNEIKKKYYNAVAVAICGQYLEYAKIINFNNRKEQAREVLKKLGLSKGYEISTIKARLDKVYSNNTGDAFSSKNIEMAKMLLDKFPKAKELLLKDFENNG